MKRILFSIPAVLLLCQCTSHGTFSAYERAVIMESDSVMYVTQLAHPGDSVILRTPSDTLSPEDLRSPLFQTLAQKMLTTVQSPQQDGVGLAAPQVGLDRRVAVVWRGDKPGGPFEVYANLFLLKRFGNITHGPEGCLSVPPMRGLVPRYDSVLVRYTDLGTMETVEETVSGYTAIIFQHECDHLDATIYIDRADTLFVSDSWVVERSPFEAAGLYARPDYMGKAVK